jgi:predicted kinase
MGDRTGVIVLSGPPCSGKTSVGRALARGRPGAASRWVHLEVDGLFALLLPGSDRSREDRMFAYDAAHHLTRMLLARGTTVVLECTYARRDQRTGLRLALADVPSAQLWVVELFVSPDTAVRRFRTRDEATDLDEHSVHERSAAFPYLDRRPRRVGGGRESVDLSRPPVSARSRATSSPQVRFARGGPQGRHEGMPWVGGLDQTRGPG